MKVIGRIMIDNNLLEQLIAFAEEKSLSKAAKKLNISQPALSKAMKKLEKIMDVSLFNRTVNSIELNDTGKIAVKYARQALKSNQAVLTNTRAFAHRQIGLHLGVCINFIEKWLAPFLTACYPKMDITYDIQNSKQLLNGIKGYQYDLVIMHDKPDDSKLYVKHYFDEQLMLTILKSDPLAAKKELHFRDLNGMSILAEQGADFWLDICKNNISNLNLIVQEDMSSLDKLVKESKLPVFNSTEALKLYPDPANKISISIVDKASIASYYLVCRKEDQSKFEKLFAKIGNR